MVVTVGSAATLTCPAASECPESRPAWTFGAIDQFGFDHLRCERPSRATLRLPKCSFTLSNDSRTSSLTINDVQLTDAGQYTCHPCRTKRSSQHLSVIGKN